MGLQCLPPSGCSKVRRCWLIRLLPLLLLASCVTIPIQEMSDARQAINSAEDVGAASLAPRSLARAHTLLISAEGFLADKDYTSAREAADGAKTNARRARRLAASFRRVSALLDDAGRIGADMLPTELLMEQARVRSGLGDEDRAAELVRQAGDAIGASLAHGYREQAGRLIDKSAAHERSMTLPQQSTLEAARSALREGELERAYQLARNLDREMRARSGNGG